MLQAGGGATRETAKGVAKISKGSNKSNGWRGGKMYRGERDQKLFSLGSLNLM